LFKQPLDKLTYLRRLPHGFGGRQGAHGKCGHFYVVAGSLWKTAMLAGRGWLRSCRYKLTTRRPGKLRSGGALRFPFLLHRLRRFGCQRPKLRVIFREYFGSAASSRNRSA
jgi:hypothetical protein